MMHKSFLHRHLRFFVVQHTCMKLYIDLILILD